MHYFLQNQSVCMKAHSYFSFFCSITLTCKPWLPWTKEHSPTPREHCTKTTQGHCIPNSGQWNAINSRLWQLNWRLGETYCPNRKLPQWLAETAVEELLWPSLCRTVLQEVKEHGGEKIWLLRNADQKTEVHDVYIRFLSLLLICILYTHNINGTTLMPYFSARDTLRRYRQTMPSNSCLGLAKLWSA